MSPIPKNPRDISDLEAFEILQQMFPDDVVDNDCDYEGVERILMEKLNVDFEQFSAIVGRMVYLGAVMESGLTGTKSHVLGIPQGETSFIALIKREAV